MLTKAQATGLWALTLLSVPLFFLAGYMGWGGVVMLAKGDAPPFVSIYLISWLLVFASCVGGPWLGWRNARAGKRGRALLLAALPFASLTLMILIVLLGHLFITHRS